MMTYLEARYELVGDESLATVLPKFKGFLKTLGPEYHAYVKKVLTEGGLVLYGLYVVMGGHETKKSHLQMLRTLDEASKKYKLMLKNVNVIDSKAFSEILRKKVPDYVEVPDGD